MTPAVKEQIDRMYREFRKTPVSPSPCPACRQPTVLMRDTDGTQQSLSVDMPVFVQIRDQEGQPTVMRVEGFVSHVAVCSGYQRQLGGLQ